MTMYNSTAVLLQVRGLITDFLSQSSAVGRPQVVQRSGSSHSMDMLRTSSSSQLVTPSPGSHSRLGSLFHRRRNSNTPKQSPDRRRSRLHLHKKHDSMSSDYNVQDTLHNAASGPSQDGDSPRLRHCHSAHGLCILWLHAAPESACCHGHYKMFHNQHKFARDVTQSCQMCAHSRQRLLLTFSSMQTRPSVSLIGSRP